MTRMSQIRGLGKLTHGEPSRFPVGFKGVAVVLASEGSTAATVSIENLPACRVLDCWAVMVGAGDTSDTFKITDGTNDISDTVDVSSAGDTDVVRVGEIDDAYRDITEGGTIAVARASAAACDVYVLVVLT